MNESDDVMLDCQTCVAVNTTACGDCVVHHILANDAGPIEFVPIPITTTQVAIGDTERVLALFAAAGLVDDEVGFVSVDDFEAARVPQLSG